MSYAMKQPDGDVSLGNRMASLFRFQIPSRTTPLAGTQSQSESTYNTTTSLRSTATCGGLSRPSRRPGRTVISLSGTRTRRRSRFHFRARILKCRTGMTCPGVVLPVAGRVLRPFSGAFTGGEWRLLLPFVLKEGTMADSEDAYSYDSSSDSSSRRSRIGETTRVRPAALCGPTAQTRVIGHRRSHRASDLSSTVPAAVSERPALPSFHAGG